MTAQELIAALSARYLDTKQMLPDELAHEAAAMLIQQAEQIEALKAALNDAATSLNTISRLAGNEFYVFEDGERVETYMKHPEQIRGYAQSRYSAAIRNERQIMSIREDFEAWAGPKGYPLRTIETGERISQHQAKEAARLEAEREKIRAEEQAKAQREAAAEASRAEAVRVAAEQMAQAAATREANELAFKDAVGAGTGITRTVVTAEQVQVAHVPVANVIPMSRPASTPPTLKLGDIADRLGFNLTADFLTNLGFEATRVKGACLYQERDFPLVLMRLVAHIQHVQAQQAA